MRGLVIFILTLVVMASFSFIVLSVNNDKIEDKSKIIEFSTFTSAVCEEKEEFVYCKDEVFVNCNGNISKADDVVECNGIKLDVSKVSGFAIFEKDWKDPRG